MVATCTIWFPFNLYGHNGEFRWATVTGYEWPYVYWEQDGVPGKSDLNKAEGKLPWRIDWPAGGAGLEYV